MSIGSQRQHVHKDPHAHVIRQPGKRLMTGIPLNFVWKKVVGHGGRSVNENLNLVPFIDFLMVTVIFLLMSFSASGEIGVNKHVKLPAAENVIDIIEAPMVVVNSNQILVDGRQVGNTRDIEELGEMRKIEGLFDLLKKTREVWKSFHPGEPFHGVAILQIDQKVPALVVKSVFQTAAFAGYPNVSFMVKKRPKVGQ